MQPIKLYCKKKRLTNTIKKLNNRFPLNPFSLKSKSKTITIMSSLIRFKQLLGILTYNEYDSVMIKDSSTLNSENLLRTESFSENHMIEKN